MPRVSELSWLVKTNVWELASILGPRPEVIMRELDCLRGVHDPRDMTPMLDCRTIRRVIDEIQSMPLEILATLPKHVWTLRDDYDRIRKMLYKEEKASSANLDPVRLEHWARLTTVAAQLLGDLSLHDFSKDVGKTFYPRYGNKIEWTTERKPKVSFSAEGRPLWPYYLRHMENEFSDFPEQLMLVKSKIEAVSHRDSFSGRIWVDSNDVGLQSDVPIKELRSLLRLVIERGTFKGTCYICKDWD